MLSLGIDIYQAWYQYIIFLDTYHKTIMNKINLWIKKRTLQINGHHFMITRISWCYAILFNNNNIISVTLRPARDELTI